jgi:prevent-host-death family protein
MEVTITELVKNVTKLVDRAEHGEEIVITRHGRAVAKLFQADQPATKRRLGTLAGVKLHAGWDEPWPSDLFEASRTDEAR